MDSSRETQGVRNTLQSQVRILAWFLALFWILEIVDTFFLSQSLNGYGIRPRSKDGLLGIVLSPFLHGGIPHLIANTVPFLILGWLVMLPRTRDIFSVTVITVVVSGLGVWLIGNTNSIHIGASGLVFGYLGFLLFRGFFERSVQAIIIAFVVGVLYGGLVWGVLPSRPGVSWEAHLFGFVGGIVAARLLAQRKHRAP